MTSNIKDCVLEAYEEIEYQYNHRDITQGIASGFYDLDCMLSGFKKSEVTIIAARHSMGKTAFALNMANNMFKHNIPVLFVSYEMNKETIMSRMLCSDAEIDSMKIRTGNMTRKDWDKLAKSLSNMAGGETEEKKDDDTEKQVNDFQLLASCGLTFKFLADEIRAFTENNSNGIVMIDYFQLIKLEEKSERIVELSALACDIKRLAVEVNLPIVLMSQISRKCEERKDKRPQVMDLSECDALAQHCDNILFIHRDDYWTRDEEDYRPTGREGKAEIIIAKQKNGPVGTIELLFQGNIVKFKNPIKTDVF